MSPQLPSSMQAPRASRAHSARDSDADTGFTLTELVVVMSIISVLAAFVIPSYFTARKASQRKTIAAAAASYQQAIDQFQLDHASRVPLPGTADWPTENAARRQQGPVDEFGRPYMRQGIPEAVSNGNADIVSATSQPGGRIGRIVYEIVPAPVPTSYRLRVQMLEGGTWKDMCAIGNAEGTTDRC